MEQENGAKRNFCYDTQSHMQLLRSCSANSASIPSEPAPMSRKWGWFITPFFLQSFRWMCFLTYLKVTEKFREYKLTNTRSLQGEKQNKTKQQHNNNNNKKLGLPFKVEKSSLDADRFQDEQRTMTPMRAFHLSSVALAHVLSRWRAATPPNQTWLSFWKNKDSWHVEREGHAHWNLRPACDRWYL